MNKAESLLYAHIYSLNKETKIYFIDDVVDCSSDLSFGCSHINSSRVLRFPLFLYNIQTNQLFIHRKYFHH